MKLTDINNLSFLKSGNSKSVCWAIPLDGMRSIWPRVNLAQFLPEFRIKRLNRFYHLDDRLRSGGGEMWIRMMLALRTGTEPGDIPIDIEEFVKPRYRPENGESGYHFNIAHSGSWILVALSESEDVGVDVEQVSAMTTDLRDTILSEKEIQMCEGMDEDELRSFLTRAWVGKEAFTKLTGKGITLPVQKITIDVHKKVSKAQYYKDPGNCWLAIDSLDVNHLWAVASNSRAQTLELSQNLNVVDAGMLDLLTQFSSVG